MDLAGLQAEAAGRSGLILSRTLPAYGVSRATRQRLIRDGWLTTVRAGVLLVGGGAPSQWQEAAAAALAAGPEAALSHSTAARLHRLACATPHEGPIEVELSVPLPAHPHLDRCRVHRVSGLGDADKVLNRGIPVTSPIRTLIDVAGALDPRLLAKTVDEGLIAGLWSEAQLDGAETAIRGRRGAVRLRRVLEPRLRESRGDTTLEQRVIRALACFSPFETGYQVVVADQVYVLDVAWPQRRVGVECDGWWVRGRSRSKFDGDRRRSNLLVSHGWTIVHLTSAMDDDEMRAAVARVLYRLTG